VEPSGRDAGKWTVVTVSGAVDTAGAARLERILAPKSMYRTRLVVDMSEVTLLGPAGLAVLAEAASRLDNQHRLLAVVVGDRHNAVLHAIENAQLQQTLRLFDTSEHAIAGTSPRQ
jgi:anti-anti-sigma factor